MDNHSISRAKVDVEMSKHRSNVKMTYYWVMAICFVSVVTACAVVTTTDINRKADVETSKAWAAQPKEK